jgi:hypothetical protein
LCIFFFFGIRMFGCSSTFTWKDFFFSIELTYLKKKISWQY